jgi:hypothetical protein
MSDSREPQASRPNLPAGYGILGPDEGKGLLPWSWAVDRLTKARNYFTATTRPNGRPHVAVVWGNWIDERFYFLTFSASRKARNLQANPNCVLCPESAQEAVIVEGVVEISTDPALIQRFADAYEAKYQEELGQASKVYVVRPRVAFAFIADAADYPATATRWKFEGD